MKFWSKETWNKRAIRELAIMVAICLLVYLYMLLTGG